MFEYVQKHGLFASIVPYSKLVIEKISSAYWKNKLKKTQSKHFKLNNTIIFECESDMDDNPRALYEYMIRNHMNFRYHMVWIVKDVDFCKKRFKRLHVDFVSRFDYSDKNQVKLQKYLSSARWFIFSHPYWFKKRDPNQIIINIDHGLPTKKPRSDAEYLVAKSYDYILYPSEFMINIFIKRYKCSPKQLVSCGYPRCDLLFEDSRKKTLKKLSINCNAKKIIVCMPTFKQREEGDDAGFIDPFCLGVVKEEQQMAELNKILSHRDYHLIIKPHPLQKKELITANNYSHIHYIFNSELLSNDLLLYNLLGSSDALITDISSVCYDYLLTKKPMGYFMNNFKSYSRGCIWDDASQFIHGNKIYSFEDLEEFIYLLENEVDLYKSEREEFCSKIWNDNSINSCSKFIDIFFSK